MRQEQVRPRRKLRHQALAIVIASLSGLLLSSRSLAGEERNYQTLLSWLQEHRHAAPAFQPGQHLTAADQETLKPFIPLPAWEYYFFPEMDMEVTAPGHYPPPQGWGEKIVAGYSLKSGSPTKSDGSPERSTSLSRFPSIPATRTATS